MKRLHGSCRGFTLVELMITVAIFVILVTVAGPSLRSLIASQQLKATSFDLTADLLLARSEALKRGASVTIRPTAGTAWTSGWQVALADDTVLSQHAAPDASVQFTDTPDAIVFDVNGRVTLPAAAVRMTLSSTGTSNFSTRCIQLDLSGRAKSALGAC